MSRTMRVLLFVAGTAVGTRPALGHHSLNQRFDLMRSITLKGTVTRINWANPHVRLYLDINESGFNDVSHWELEMSSPNQMFLQRITIDNLRRGDQITVTAYPARDGSHLAYARTINRPEKF